MRHPLRIAVGGLVQETNTFVRRPTTLADFARGVLVRERELIDFHAGTRTVIGGILGAATELGAEVVSTLYGHGGAGGAVERDTYEALVGELVERIASARPVDAVVLALHGALVTEDHLDGTGELLRRVRAQVGPNVPVTGALDLHANATDAMADSADALVGYDTYPHVDRFERGDEACRLAESVARGRLRPVQALARAGILAPPQGQFTDRAPMRTLLERAHELEDEPGIVAVSVLGGFPYADVPDAGVAVLAVSDGDRSLARRVAGQVAELAWELRDGFLVRNASVEEAVRRALTAERRPVILVDAGDNIGGGSPGDGTVLLAALLQAGATDSLIVLCDPEAVATCASAGVGTRVQLRVGGKTDDLHGPAIDVVGSVRLLANGIFRTELEGTLVHMGRTVVLDVAENTLVLNEHKTPPWSLRMLRSLGIEPTELRIVVVKAAIAYRAAFAPIAGEIIEVDTPGLCSTDLTELPYQRVRRPIFPLDRDA